jgi:micrococcal nuclease
MILLYLLCLLLSSCQQDSTRTYRLSKSLDGDSMFVTDYNCRALSCPQTELRLLGIDSPEYSQDPWGKRASEFLLSQIHGDTKLFLETSSPVIDKYGRTLAFLYYETNNEKKFLNYEMLKNGYAQLFIISKNFKHATALKDAEAYARTHKLHIWQESNGLTMSPYKYRKLKFKKK